MCPSEFEIGYLLGILVGEGHFGGDGRQPHITLRMHTDHEQLFRWLERTFPGGRLYGPYHHAGRRYFQWMARGPFLRDALVPLLEQYLTPDLDAPAWNRFQAMKERYPSLASRSRPPRGETTPTSSPSQPPRGGATPSSSPSASPPAARAASPLPRPRNPAPAGRRSPPTPRRSKSG